MRSNKKPGLPRTLSFEELTVWKTKLPDVQFAVLPPSNTRPNPLAAADRLYVSVFAPGAVCALERESGKLIWHREIAKYGGASVYLHGGKLFAKTEKTLFALSPDSGERLWSFCPYGGDGESMYSSPSARENRIYIGDRLGYLHCLDVDSGKTIWRRHTNRAHNRDVNSTPLLMHGLVIVPINAKMVVAFEEASGKLVWKQRLDGPSHFGPLVHQGSVLVPASSLYLLDPKTGKVRRRFSWGSRRLQQVESTPRSIVLTFWPESYADLASGKAKVEQVRGSTTDRAIVILIAKSGVQRTEPLAESCPSFRYTSATRLLYLSHTRGIDLFRHGVPACQLKTSQDARNGFGLVDVKGGKIYALSGAGTVYSLRHPA
jgi:outer membrane protein assembly factor BamB